MSGTILYTPATGADWATAWEQTEYNRKGKIGISLTNMTATTLPAIASGSWCEVAGSIYKWTVEEAISGSPSTGLLNYITLVPSGSGDTAILTPTWSTTAPTWSDAYLGWYSSTTRYVAKCFYTGSEYVEKRMLADQRDRASAYVDTDKSHLSSRFRVTEFETDFLAAGAWGNYFTSAAISSGTLTEIDGEANHPGIVRFSNGGGSNSGWKIGTNPNGLLLAGREIVEFVFRNNGVSTYNREHLGLHDCTTGSENDAVMIYIAGATLAGVTNNNGSSTQTGTNYTISAATWYRGLIVVNTDATRADFYLYSAAGALLWHDYNTTNLPVGRALGIAFQAYCTTAATDFLDMDWMSFRCDKELTR